MTQHAHRLLVPGLALVAALGACRAPVELPPPDTVFATVGLLFET